ncbi:hypothetical protein OSB04_022512 [Centaurea solstitialis]|uniref:Reverse transcriptase Ty1/copia-type domain-containing protein n=1 Tax=Centaurea solstitialis TaxID=347529 RepID=A0AA38SXX7_9ASTR|nr:hypothetical protein OSB04_022512 [Centaurea solstitialis]
MATVKIALGLLSLSTIVLVHLPRMVVLNINIVTFLIMSASFTVVYTINRHPNTVLKQKSLYKALFVVSPAYELLKVWDCACFVQLQSYEPTNLNLDLDCAIFLGYRLWDHISKRLRISRHVPFSTVSTFHESPTYVVPFFTDSFVSLESLQPDLISSPDTTQNTKTSEPEGSPDPSVPIPHSQSSIPSSGSTSEPSVESTDPGPSSSKNVRRSDQVRQVPSHLTFVIIIDMLLCYPIMNKLPTMKLLLQTTMKEELRALDKAHTWESVRLPLGESLIGSKRIFKIKTKSNGFIYRYKARLVAKDFNQKYVIDYEETLALVAHVTSVCNLLAIATTKCWPLFQMDVKNAFLNDDLSKKVYMTPPPGVSRPSVKHVSRAWFEKFSNTVISLGFSASNYDSKMFTRTINSRTILLILYVDDMIITDDF